MNYIKAVKERFKHEPTVYAQFLDILKDFKFQVCDTRGVVRRINKMFKEKSDLVSGFNTFLPPGFEVGEIDSDEEEQMGGLPQKPQQDFDLAYVYITSVKRRFAKQPEMYKKFLEILHTYEDQKIPLKNVYAGIEKLFSRNNDLIEGFTNFLPPRVQKKRRYKRRRKSLYNALSEGSAPNELDGLTKEEVDESVQKVTPDRFFELLRSRMSNQGYFEFVQFSRMWLAGKMNKFDYMKVCHGLLPDETNGKLFRMFESLMSTDNVRTFRVPDEIHDPEKIRFGPSYSITSVRGAKKTYRGRSQLHPVIRESMNVIYESSNVFEKTKHPSKTKTEREVFDIENERTDFEIRVDLNASVQRQLQLLLDHLKKEKAKLEDIETSEVSKPGDRQKTYGAQELKNRKSPSKVAKMRRMQKLSQFHSNIKDVVGKYLRQVHQSFFLDWFGRSDGRKIMSGIYTKPLEVIPVVQKHLERIHNHQLQVLYSMDEETKRLEVSHHKETVREETELFQERENTNLNEDCIREDYVEWFKHHEHKMRYLRNKKIQSDMFLLLVKCKAVRRREYEKIRELWKRVIVPFLDLDNQTDPEISTKRRSRRRSASSSTESTPQRKTPPKQKLNQNQEMEEMDSVVHCQPPFSPLRDYSNRLYASLEYVVFFHYYTILYDRLLQIRTHLIPQTKSSLTLKYARFMSCLLSYLKGEVNEQMYIETCTALLGNTPNFVLTTNLKLLIQKFSAHVSSMISPKNEVSNTILSSFQYFHAAKNAHPLLIHKRSTDRYFESINQFLCAKAPEIRLFLFRYEPYKRKMTMTRVHDEYVSTYMTEQRRNGEKYLRESLLTDPKIPAPPPPPTPVRARARARVLRPYQTFIPRRKLVQKHIFPIRVYLPRNKNRSFERGEVQVENGLTHRIRMRDYQLQYAPFSFDIQVRILENEEKKKKVFRKIGSFGVSERKKRFRKFVEKRNEEIEKLYESISTHSTYVQETILKQQQQQHQMQTPPQPPLLLPRNVGGPPIPHLAPPPMMVRAAAPTTLNLPEPESTVKVSKMNVVDTEKFQSHLLLLKKQKELLKQKKIIEMKKRQYIAAHAAQNSKISTVARVENLVEKMKGLLENQKKTNLVAPPPPIPKEQRSFPPTKPAPPNSSQKFPTKTPEVINKKQKQIRSPPIKSVVPPPPKMVPTTIMKSTPNKEKLEAYKKSKELISRMKSDPTEINRLKQAVVASSPAGTVMTSIPGEKKK